MSRYLISAMEQALWSLLNLGVNLLLIRATLPDQYGAFAFWANCGFILASLQNALTVPHFQVLPPAPGTSPERLLVERLMHAVTCLYLAAVAVSILVVALAWRASGGAFGQPAAALFVPAFLLQQYMRALAFSRGAPLAALAQTGAALGVGVAAIAVPVLLGRRLDADEIMLLLGLAYGLVGAVAAVLAVKGQGVRVSLAELAAYRRYLTNSGWLVLGVTTTELLSRFYAFAAAGAFGAATLASLSASQILLRPVPLLASSWSMVARGDLARRTHDRDGRGFGLIILAALGAGLAAAGVWGALTFHFWPALSRILFKGKYAQDQGLVALWAVAGALSLSQTVVSTGLQVRRSYRALALTNAVAALAAATSIVALIRWAGPPGAIAGTVLGQAVEVTIMAALLWRGVRGDARGTPRPAAGPSPQIEVDSIEQHQQP